MDLKTLLKQRKATIYQISKKSGVPYSTLNDLVNEKTTIKLANAQTLYLLSVALDCTMDQIYNLGVKNKTNFDDFRAVTLKEVKEIGDKAFIEKVIKSYQIRKYYNEWKIEEALYLLGLIDYLCDENKLPRFNEYDDLRDKKLGATIYPIGVSLAYRTSKDKKYLKEAMANAIPVFLRHNIVEVNIRNI